MSHDEHRLVRHLAWVVVIKLLALVGLWWMFVRDQHVSTDAAAAARHLAAPAPDQGEPR
ncbi:cytochrome oxidase putative small subunit CydP [Roseateles sp. BYS78W]|uniref:Cytochrome oxidase putative small subunit CydP n=1 Tax=Pelomonas candidula TaxID=3299025 RepID=A0ABW7HAJ8_9BURK